MSAFKYTNRYCAKQKLPGAINNISKLRMRAPKIKPRVLEQTCLVCRRNACIDNRLPRVVYHFTRSFTKYLATVRKFIIIEVYRCMPLLGDEQEKVPDWNMHIVRYFVLWYITLLWPVIIHDGMFFAMAIYFTKTVLQSGFRFLIQNNFMHIDGQSDFVK